MEKVKLDGFLGLRLSKKGREDLEIIANGRSLGGTIRTLIEEATHQDARYEIRRLRKIKEVALRSAEDYPPQIRPPKTDLI